MTFTRAEKKTAKLRLALMGPSGSGKTYSALGIAQGLGKRVALIDTEAGSAALYADLFSFDIDELTMFHPQLYVDAIHEAEKAGYDVLIIDSLSHAWNGKGGALELVDDIAANNRGNKFAGWKEVTPLQNRLVEAILRCRAHVIATMRAKTEYVLEKDERTGKTSPRKVGLAPIQRDNIESEFTFVVELDEGSGLVTKTRWPELFRATVKHPGREFGEKLMGWLRDGKEPLIGREDQVKLFAKLGSSGRTKEELRAYLADRFGDESTSKIPVADFHSVCTWVEGEPKATPPLAGFTAAGAAAAISAPASTPAAAPKATPPRDDGHGLRPPAELKGKPAAKPDPKAETLSMADVLRLSELLQANGKTKADFIDHVGRVFGVEDAYGLRKADYDKACDWIIGRGEYADVMSKAREPGSDDGPDATLANIPL